MDSMSAMFLCCVPVLALCGFIVFSQNLFVGGLFDF